MAGPTQGGGIGSGTGVGAHWKEPVINPASLPLTGNSAGDRRTVLDDGDAKPADYEWTGLLWIKMADPDGATADGVLKIHDYSGLADGIKVNFTLSPPATNVDFILVVKRGLVQRVGALPDGDYVIDSPSSITFHIAPDTDDTVLVYYAE
jgi:hypothetical protein